MRRPPPQSPEAAGQDSFLDIVANMVGILIILVMVAGVRAGKAPVELPDDEKPAPREALAAAQSEAKSLAGDIRELDRQAQQVERDIALRRAQQERLATLIAAIKEELAARRSELSSENQRQYDLRRELAEARAKLAQLDREIIALDAAKPKTVEVQNLPTPISRTVHGREFHFQLIGGRLTFIPLEPLLERFKRDAPNKLWKFNSQSRVSDTVGPIDGFRLRYELEQTGPAVRLVKWELLPVSDDLGEPVEEALKPGSRLRSLLARIGRDRATLTIWTYPDSFAEFRTLKADLHARGFATAGRPLPAGQLIGGSPDGSRSAAQ
jgi:hypothetical protein